MTAHYSAARAIVSLPSWTPYPPVVVCPREWIELTRRIPRDDAMAASARRRGTLAYARSLDRGELMVQLARFAPALRGWDFRALPLGPWPAARGRITKSA